MQARPYPVWGGREHCLGAGSGRGSWMHTGWAGLPLPLSSEFIGFAFVFYLACIKSIPFIFFFCCFLFFEIYLYITKKDEFI